ncbi:uncharacterized protein EV154DRAFT_516585, partial [Mucor mucedo]|uniref:uncharacterized protein n=1 Tax=Mucor mucedo TaxID=29922 RepID=UPI002221103F
MQQEKLSLPSIEFMLPKVEVCLKEKPKRQHRASHSISSLPSELQQLSISAPAYIPDEKSENNQPSWMVMMPSAGANSISRHGRSLSEFPPLPVIKHRHQTHKRSASANTPHLSFTHHTTTTTVRARTDSPPTVTMATPQEEEEKSHTATEALYDALNLKKEKKYDTLMVARDEHTGRYYCPFCNKAFNRPSSLRIHTYSHTGEKPFACQEEGCGRQFSVQSNMRRHLRVHQLGKSKVKVPLP